MRALTGAQLAAYGALGLPLAMAALPLYVHVPKFYGGEVGLPLALVGAVLLATRIVDAVSDPLLGWLSDRGSRRERFTLAALPLLAAGMLALFHPPAGAGAAWLAGALVLASLGFSMATIAYQAWGAQLSDDVHERTRVAGAREIFTLAGVVCAAALPAAFAGEGGEGFARASWVFVALLAACAVATLGFAPRPARRAAATAGLRESLAAPLANRDFRRLLAAFVLSGIAAAIPSTLVLFFVEDVLRSGHLAWLFLVIYFVAGAAGIPVWVRLAGRLGKRRAWMLGMVLAVAAFAWAWRLGPGDTLAFAAICVLSGFALGADLALPPAILADVIDGDRRGSGQEAAGSYFGLWALVAKANLALAAGLALPALDALGYVPGDPGGERSLALLYGLLPCAFKLGAVAVLWWQPAPRPAIVPGGAT